ncbi:uncharacterized protein LOC114281406 [Camellia sinensis]|uniref:uncharacterized protein LOC114281406 n=1 Tax=Camellia sinensis TaxID=4442 RepID=UPI00103563C4|nr:uncharacterized protein LOC114281406 [Camellia sinensis]
MEKKRAIAYLIHRDYAAIVKDFVKLDFIPDGVNLEPILPILAKSFDQALEGGGAKNINFQEQSLDLAQITFDYPFRIPPYFALIIRAIGVLEGIALVGDPDFAIIDEAYLYIAQRLLTDESPCLMSSLRYTIYGKFGVFDAERFIDVMQAFENFITAAKSGGGEDLNGDMTELGILQIQRRNAPVFPFPFSSSQSEQPIQTRAALAFLLSEKGNFFREFLLDERLLTDESPCLRSALPYTIYGKFGVFDAERFIDVMQAFENFITAAKSGGGEDLNGDMTELGILQIQRRNVPIFPFPFSSSQSEQPIQTRAALAFLLLEKGNFFREFLLDECATGVTGLNGVT